MNYVTFSEIGSKGKKERIMVTIIIVLLIIIIMVTRMIGDNSN